MKTEISPLRLLLGLPAGAAVATLLDALAGVGVWAITVGTVGESSTAVLWAVFSIGLWQWLYLGPLAYLAWRFLERSLAIGVIVGICVSGALVFLVTAGCGGFILLMG